MSDWIGDPNLSREEKLAHFEALDPQPTKSPIPGNGLIVGPAQSSGAGFIVKSGRSSWIDNGTTVNSTTVAAR